MRKECLKFIKIVLSALFLFPVLAFAATLKDVLGKIIVSLSGIPALLIAGAVIYFLLAVLQYAMSADPKTSSDARNKIFLGLAGIFIMTSMWAFVAIVKRSLGL